MILVLWTLNGTYCYCWAITVLVLSDKKKSGKGALPLPHSLYISKNKGQVNIQGENQYNF